MFKNDELHIVEPTLRDQTGHCYSLLNDLVAASERRNDSQCFHIWQHRQAGNLFGSHGRVIQHNYFSRRARRLQALWLYGKLITNNHRVFISTATSTDILLLNWAARLLEGKNSSRLSSVKLYVHWLYRSSRRQARLKKVAQRFPSLSIACPTPTVESLLAEAGFKNVQRISYPSAADRNQMNTAADSSQSFSGLLYAGAAREDKGFPLIVELATLLHKQNSNIPFTIQCSVSHKGIHSKVIQSALTRLEQVEYAPMRLIMETLDQTFYASMFSGSVVLQPYRTDLFRDRVSGVTLDALKAGCPVIVPAGTWMANVVDRFGAGLIVVNPQDVLQWKRAIDRAIENWEVFSVNARKAAAMIKTEHAPEHLINWLYS